MKIGSTCITIKYIEISLVSTVVQQNIKVSIQTLLGIFSFHLMCARKKKTRGRPRRRWSQDITERRKTTITQAGRIAQDRTVYREAVMDVTCRKGHAT